MLLITGLGNPGTTYARNRHNIGFMAVDAIADAANFGPERSRFQGRVREGRLGSEKVLTLKPDTFMNASGRAVAEAVRFYKLEPEDVIVIHDELDLIPGKIRLKTGGGHAGHNGLRSITDHIGADFRRVRLGIGHPGHKSKVSGYVLHDFAKSDGDWLDPLLNAMARHAAHLAAGEDAKFQAAVAQEMLPAKPKNESPAKTSPKPPITTADDPKPAATSPFEALKRLITRD